MRSRNIACACAHVVCACDALVALRSSNVIGSTSGPPFTHERHQCTSMSELFLRTVTRTTRRASSPCPSKSVISQSPNVGAARQPISSSSSSLGSSAISCAHSPRNTSRISPPSFITEIFTSRALTSTRTSLAFVFGATTTLAVASLASCRQKYRTAPSPSSRTTPPFRDISFTTPSHFLTVGISLASRASSDGESAEPRRRRRSNASASSRSLSITSVSPAPGATFTFDASMSPSNASTSSASVMRGEGESTTRASRPPPNVTVDGPSSACTIGAPRRRPWSSSSSSDDDPM
mmetsp:Transcript_4967/g.18037  ORF Transcript_4967/g.18037 Transcript_4967/m.18037 type:complete len:293 (-) Transcript_4967:62-940(-)